MLEGVAEDAEDCKQATVQRGVVARELVAVEERALAADAQDQPSVRRTTVDVELPGDRQLAQVGQEAEEAA